METSRELLDAFNRSGAVKRGGPGGFPVIVGRETWSIGYSPSSQFFASNAASDPEAGVTYCRYVLDHRGHLWRNRSGTPSPEGGWRENDLGDEYNTSEEEVRWLIDLIEAAEDVIWGAGDLTSTSSTPNQLSRQARETAAWRFFLWLRKVQHYPRIAVSHSLRSSIERGTREVEKIIQTNRN